MVGMILKVVSLLVFVCWVVCEIVVWNVFLFFIKWLVVNISNMGLFFCLIVVNVVKVIVGVVFFFVGFKIMWDFLL